MKLQLHDILAVPTELKEGALGLGQERPPRDAHAEFAALGLHHLASDADPVPERQLGETLEVLRPVGAGPDLHPPR